MASTETRLGSDLRPAAGTQSAETFPPAMAPFTLGLVVVVLLLLSVSPMALANLGLNYEEAGGSPLQKVHPATGLLALLLAGALVLTRHPVRQLEAMALATPGAALLVAALPLLALHSLLILKLPVTQLIDVYLLAVMLFWSLAWLDRRRLAAIGFIVHGMIVLNAVIGIAEFAAGFRLTPFVAGGVSLATEWRSTALLGHPLNNAILTGCYIMALVAGRDGGLPAPLRITAIALTTASMAVFGGRAATLMLIAALALMALASMLAIAAGQAFRIRGLILALLAIPPVAAGLIVLASAGYLDRFLERFQDDEGSAGARLAMFEIFQHLDWHDFLLAPDPVHIQSLQSRYGIEFGVESFWVATVLQYGLIPALVFFLAFLAFLVDLWRRSGTGAAYVLAYFLAVATTSLSLAGKSHMLAVVVLIVMTLTGRAEQARRRPAVTGVSVPGTGTSGAV